MSNRNEIRDGVKDGLVDHDVMGCGFILILVECVLLGVTINVVLKDWNANLASWLGWGSGLLLFFLFFIPKVRTALIHTFSACWALLGYTIVRSARNEIKEDSFAEILSLSPSPIPYVVAIIIFLLSWGFHSAYTD